jgi:hypothetical protein
MTGFLDRLADQFGAADRALISANAPAHRRPRWRSRNAAILALGLTASGTAVAVAATTVFSGGGPVSIGQYEAGRRAPLATVVPPAQAAAFAILRRPAGAADAVPPSLLPAQLVGVYGADATLARRIGGSSAALAAWVVPGNGSLCLVADSGSVCGPDAALITHGLYMESGGAGTPGTQSVVGLVPDGVDAVTLTLADGSRRLVDVVANG